MHTHKYTHRALDSSKLAATTILAFVHKMMTMQQSSISDRENETSESEREKKTAGNCSSQHSAWKRQ